MIHFLAFVGGASFVLFAVGIVFVIYCIGSAVGGTKNW